MRLHDPARQAVLTSPTDTGSGGYTHKYFRVAHSAADLAQQQTAIADWSRMSYGWMGRTPDYKAALMNTLGANADWYGPFKDNALAWHKRAQEAALFMNHAIVNPPIDRHKPAEQVKDVFVHITKESDAGIWVSGAKVVATSSALTHYNFLAQSSATVTEDPSLSVMFIVPMNAPGIKMFCRVSYEQTANMVGHPFDYPLSSRFDENDAILVLDNVFIPWEDVLVLRDAQKILSFHPASGFMHGYCFQGCTRFAVKLDFLAGLLAKALAGDRRRRLPRQPGGARRSDRAAPHVLELLQRHGATTRSRGRTARCCPIWRRRSPTAPSCRKPIRASSIRCAG